MARIRTIKPSMFRSESVCTLSPAVRWTLAGLFTYADDEGRGRDEARLIKSELYPLDDRMTPAKVAEHLAQIEALPADPDGVPTLCRYVMDGTDYLHFPKWRMHQRVNRPTPSRIPPCPKDHGLFTDSSVIPQ